MYVVDAVYVVVIFSVKGMNESISIYEKLELEYKQSIRWANEQVFIFQVLVLAEAEAEADVDSNTLFVS